eukprot:TRINITY_DN29386_c0_g1_i2.p1 TRINITY_DN29386_c0_g1~~TRINITY_DN29386_c0_g1_i2.p1  ORF type:complete len:144 (+),score=25.57 TRINITY_DN29386_c0_g1_i2:84-515(+)
MGAAVTVPCLSEQCRGHVFTEEHNADQDAVFLAKDTIQVDLSHIQVTAYREGIDVMPEVEADMNYQFNQQRSAEIWCEWQEDLVSSPELPRLKDITSRQRGTGSGILTQANKLFSNEPTVSKAAQESDDVPKTFKVRSVIGRA